ncbi:ciliary microtubule inner protein 1 [Andrena cerasifolii]|uniref:ciliary microtubule inner protein 1 n=1 Tax=Andrena cerasifolii TaxID=2819439 RepID=UPI0040381BEA
MVDETQEARKSEKSSVKRGEHPMNPVTFDSICKEVILRDKVCRRRWPRKYEHLTGELFKKVLAEECRKEGLPADTFERRPAEDAIKRSPIPLKQSPSVPRTTSGMVGLRSSRPEHNLEFTGRWYISPKRTLEPPVGAGEFRVTQQRFIYLG